MLAKDWTAQLFGEQGGSGGGTFGSAVSSFLSRFMKSSSGSSSFGIPLPGSGRIKGFAMGTDFAPGGWAMVGERGPELVNLPRGSQVIPHNRMGGRGNTVITNINVSENTSKATASQIAMKSGQAAQRAISRNA